MNDFEPSSHVSVLCGSYPTENEHLSSIGPGCSREVIALPSIIPKGAGVMISTLFLKPDLPMTATCFIFDITHVSPVTKFRYLVPTDKLQ